MLQRRILVSCVLITLTLAALLSGPPARSASIAAPVLKWQRGGCLDQKSVV